MGGMGGIYFTAIDAYARRFGIAGAAFDTFMFLLGELDDEYLKWVAERQEEAARETRETGPPLRAS